MSDFKTSVLQNMRNKCSAYGKSWERKRVWVKTICAIMVHKWSVDQNGGLLNMDNFCTYVYIRTILHLFLLLLKRVEGIIHSYTFD